MKEKIIIIYSHYNKNHLSGTSVNLCKLLVLPL